MLDLHSSLMLLATLAALALAASMILIYGKTEETQKRANLKLETQSLHWELFRLEELPSGERARNEFFVRRAHENGLVQGMQIEGVLLVFVALWIMLRWAFYPHPKKHALHRLANEENLSAEEIRHLAQSLRA